MDLFGLVEGRKHENLKNRLERSKEGLEFLNSEGKSPLQVAVEMNNLPGMGLLIEAKANVNFITQECVSLLDVALSKSNSVAGQMLYDNGAKTRLSATRTF